MLLASLCEYSYFVIVSIAYRLFNSINYAFMKNKSDTKMFACYYGKENNYYFIHILYEVEVARVTTNNEWTYLNMPKV